MAAPVMRLVWVGRVRTRCGCDRRLAGCASVWRAYRRVSGRIGGCWPVGVEELRRPRLRLRCRSGRVSSMKRPMLVGAGGPYLTLLVTSSLVRSRAVLSASLGMSPATRRTASRAARGGYPGSGRGSRAACFGAEPWGRECPRLHTHADDLQPLVERPGARLLPRWFASAVFFFGDVVELAGGLVGGGLCV